MSSRRRWIPRGEEGRETKTGVLAEKEVRGESNYSEVQRGRVDFSEVGCR